MRRFFPVVLLLIGMGPASTSFGQAAATPAADRTPETFAIETYVGRTYNYLDNMVDKDGLPYFNIFWTDPAEAAHDWPDFGDVMSRQLQAAIMARHLTGKEAAQREALDEKSAARTSIRRRACSMRPKTSFSEPGRRPGRSGPDALRPGDRLCRHDKIPTLRAAIDKMVDHLPKLYTPDHWLRGFIIKSLMTWVRLTGSKPALEQAGKLVRSCFDENAAVLARQHVPPRRTHARQPADAGRCGRLRAVRERPRALQPGRCRSTATCARKERVSASCPR